jgi:NhaP-type Na+/H+ or K+/H+ antiporter
MLPVAAALAGTHARTPTVAFMGWFGPRGLASIVFTVIVLDEANLRNVATITVTVVFTIVLSVYAHGLSSRPLTARYAAWYRAHPHARPPEMESVHAPHQRWRRPTAIPVAHEPTPRR